MSFGIFRYSNVIKINTIVGKVTNMKYPANSTEPCGSSIEHITDISTTEKKHKVLSI